MVFARSCKPGAGGESAPHATEMLPQGAREVSPHLELRGVLQKAPARLLLSPGHWGPLGLVLHSPSAHAGAFWKAHCAPLELLDVSRQEMGKMGWGRNLAALNSGFELTTKNRFYQNGREKKL